METVREKASPDLQTTMAFRRTPDSGMSIRWSLATTGAGAVWAGAVYLLGDDGVFGAALLIWPVLVGLCLGYLQGLVFRQYIEVQRWWMWIGWTTVAWTCAMLCLVLPGVILLAASGLNPEGDVRGCLVAVWGLAGAVFGWIQSPPIARLGLPGLLWAMTNGFAWLVGGWVGGIAGFTVYEAIAGGRYVDRGSVEVSTSMAVGLFVAMLVIGVFTGLVLVWLLREILREETTNLSEDPGS